VRCASDDGDGAIDEALHVDLLQLDHLFIALAQPIGEPAKADGHDQVVEQGPLSFRGIVASGEAAQKRPHQGAVEGIRILDADAAD